MKKKISLILEFGIPPYRDFLFKYLDKISANFLTIHNGDKFQAYEYQYPTYNASTIKILKFIIHLNIFNHLRKSDVIIGSFNFWRPSCWLPMFFLNKRYILWGHIKGSHENIISTCFKRICIKKADYILSYTDKGRDYAIEKLGAHKDKVLVVRNTLLVTNATFSIKERKYFIYVGRIQERKKLSIFIRSLTSINHDGELFRIVGDGEHKNELIKLVSDLQLNDKVKFFNGTFDEEILKSHFENAIAYVSPSQIGLGLVHSFAYGVPGLLDVSEKHGPEFEYCSQENSYLYNGQSKIFSTIEDILKDRANAKFKGESAYKFYRSYLNVDNMEKAFYKAVYE